MPEDDLPNRSIGRLGVQRTTWHLAICTQNVRATLGPLGTR